MHAKDIRGIESLPKTLMHLTFPHIIEGLSVFVRSECYSHAA